jgi:hypothetical protein
MVRESSASELLIYSVPPLIAFEILLERFLTIGNPQQCKRFKLVSNMVYSMMCLNSEVNVIVNELEVPLRTTE